MELRTTAVVPSAGASPVARECLEALRGEADRDGLAIVWVHQGSGTPPALARAHERLIALPEPAGFARAANVGLAAVATGYAALVNDDAVVEPGWLPALEAALDAEGRLAAAQGVIVDAGDPSVVDGAGIAWNRWWQAVQVARGESAPPREAPPFEVFGVSATAALYRVSALRAVALAGGAIFDERLGSYYEDVDLAARLRAAGFPSRAAPAARARHRGAASFGRAPARRAALVYGNRWLVLHAILGEEFPRFRRVLLARDLRDLARAVVFLRLALAGGIVAGWSRARSLRAGFARPGPSRPALPELERFRVGSTR